jgi:hypothetical protein
MSRRTVVKLVNFVCSYGGYNAYLKHCEKQMLFTALVLVAVDGEHDRLQQRIDFGHADEPAEVSNVFRLGLEKEKQIAVSLHFFVVWEEAFLHFGRVFEMASHLVTLYTLRQIEALELGGNGNVCTSSSAMRFWMSKAIRESRYRTSFSSTKFFFDCDDIFAFSSRSVFWAIKGSA